MFAFEKAKGEAEKARAQADVPREILLLHDAGEARRRPSARMRSSRRRGSSFESFRVSSRAELENLRIALEKAGREIEAAQRTLDALTLHAPKSGIFVISDNWNEDASGRSGILVAGPDDREHPGT
jgi:hypothetical protein